MAPLLEVEDLKVHFKTDDGVVKAVDGISYTVDAGQTLQVTLTFAKAAPVVAEVPVVPRAEPYESVPTPADTGGRGAGGG